MVLVVTKMCCWWVFHRLPALKNVVWLLQTVDGVGP